MKVHIEVTQEDIDNGCQLDTTGADGGCMVWRAFQRCTEGAFPVVTVQYRSIEVFDSRELQEDELESLVIPLPAGVEEQIQSFDDDDGDKKAVKPFVFDIEIPVGAGK